MRHGFRPRLTPALPPPEWWMRDDDWNDYGEEYRDEYEDALEDCGQVPHLGGGCLNAGTEYCDFECPFRDELLSDNVAE
jgi:hypothetical protein